jgi:hypothetical protein
MELRRFIHNHRVFGHDRSVPCSARLSGAQTGNPLDPDKNALLKMLNTNSLYQKNSSCNKGKFTNIGE